LPNYEAVRASSDTNVATPGQHIHMPSPSYFPIVCSFGLLVAAYGMIMGHTNGANYVVAGIGFLITVGGLYAWGLEPSAEPEEEQGGENAPHQPALLGASGGTMALDAPETAALPTGETTEGGTEN
jgi:hypothetical protein